MGGWGVRSEGGGLVFMTQQILRKLTELEKIAILRTATMLVTYNKVTNDEALSRAFSLFDLVEKHAAKWEEERYKLDIAQQRRQERGY